MTRDEVIERIKVIRLRGPRGRGRLELSKVRSYEILSEPLYGPLNRCGEFAGPLTVVVVRISLGLIVEHTDHGHFIAIARVLETGPLGHTTSLRFCSFVFTTVKRREQLFAPS